MANNNLLMVGNFSSGTGYAWNMINSCFYALGHEFIKKNNEACICYPIVDEVNPIFIGSNIDIMEFDFLKVNLYEVFKFLKNKKIKNLYLINHSTFSFIYSIARLAGVKKIIVHDHASSGVSSTNSYFKKIMKTILNRMAFFNPDKILVISEFVKTRKVVGACFPEKKIEVIYNGVDVEEFQGAGIIDFYKEFNIPSGKKIVFCAARANLYKGVDFFIEAARELIYELKRNDLFFLYCGEGPDLAKFKKMVAEYDLSKFFRFGGNSNKINEILKSVHVCVVPSVWQEGFGLMVIESMAAGVPVIATRVGGMAEIIDDGLDGIYVEPGDSKAIVSALERILNDARLADDMSANGRKKVFERYTRDHQEQKIINSFKPF